MELFTFTENWVIESVFYKVTLDRSLLSDTVLRLHNLQTEVRIIVHVVDIDNTRIVEAGIDRLSRGDYFGGMTRGVNLSKFIPFQF